MSDEQREKTKENAKRSYKDYVLKMKAKPEAVRKLWEEKRASSIQICRDTKPD